MSHVKISWVRTKNLEVTFKLKEETHILVSSKVKTIKLPPEGNYLLNEAVVHWNNLKDLGFTQI